MSQENTSGLTPPVYHSESPPNQGRGKLYRLPLMPRIAYILACLSLMAMVVQLMGHSAANRHPFVPYPWTIAWRLTIVAGPAGLFLGAAWLWHHRYRAFVIGRNHAWSAILVGAAGAAIGHVAAPGFEESAEVLHYSYGLKAMCLSNLKQLDSGLTMYAQDYDDHLPLPHTWSDASYPYVKNEGVYICPQPYDNDDDSKIPTYGFLRKLEGVEMGRITSPPTDTVMLFDSVRGRNLSGGIGLLPNPPRHRNGDNVGLLDGHAKFIERSKVSRIWNPTITQASESAPKKASTP